MLGSKVLTDRFTLISKRIYMCPERVVKIAHDVSWCSRQRDWHENIKEMYLSRMDNANCPLNRLIFKTLGF